MMRVILTMKKEPKTIADEYTVDAACVQVFAKVVASISHEVKNVLAIINENGGLLEDIILMSEPGQGVPPDYIRSAAAAISSQVQRANRIMKNCNRLAHLGDRTIAEEPLAEILELMAALVQRQADMKHMTIAGEYQADIRIVAPMLPFASLVYLLFRAIIDAGQNDSTITVSAASLENTITLTFNVDLPAEILSQIVENGDIEAL
ncbi:MAG: hypothetical protein CSA26_00450, partial [Desulfobacterales bacterium]